MINAARKTSRLFLTLNVKQCAFFIRAYRSPWLLCRVGNFPSLTGEPRSRNSPLTAIIPDTPLGNPPFQSRLGHRNIFHKYHLKNRYRQFTILFYHIIGKISSVFMTFSRSYFADKKLHRPEIKSTYQTRQKIRRSRRRRKGCDCLRFLKKA